MKKETIYKTDQFKLISFGFGVSYQFIDLENMQVIYLQGDDAAKFETELLQSQDANPYASINAILSFMWFQYSDIAQPIETPANWPLIVSHAEMLRA
jgi:hypothetical protein